ncbi:MAG TPA: hypothetical protein DC064_18635, partial [Cyanobacteria bacterium UBA9273]|nr:hypothetical protein [Cyanobacteria bacterium UBA9273]
MPAKDLFHNTVKTALEIGVANELVEAGVPKEDIVLTFHAPYKRKYTELAVG